MSRVAFIREGQAEMDRKIPDAGNGSPPCFAIAWGVPACNFVPCKEQHKREHGPPKPEWTRLAAQFARSRNFPETYAAYQQQIGTRT